MFPLSCFKLVALKRYRMLAISTVMEIVNKNGSLLAFFVFFHSFCIVPSSVIFQDEGSKSVLAWKVVYAAEHE